MKNAYWSSCKVPIIFVSDFNEILVFWTDFCTLLIYQVSWKSIQWEPRCSMQTDRVVTKLIVPFCNFANATRNCIMWSSVICAVCVVVWGRSDWESWHECCVSCAWGEMRVVRDVIKKSKLKNHWEDLDVSGGKIFKYISVKYCSRMWIGFSCFRIWTSGGMCEHSSDLHIL